MELELGQVSKERGDLSNQLSSLARKKEALNEELMRLRQRLEQANETNARLNRDMEDLMKDKEGKQVKHNYIVSVIYLFKVYFTVSIACHIVPSDRMT